MTLPYTPRGQQVLRVAEQIAKSLNHSYIGQEHMFLAMLKLSEQSLTKNLMNNKGVTYETVLSDFFGYKSDLKVVQDSITKI